MRLFIGGVLGQVHSVPPGKAICITYLEKFIACKPCCLAALILGNGRVFREDMSSEFPSRNGYGNAHPTAHDALCEEHLSDEQLMLDVQQGDGNAFTVLFDRYNRLVLTVALRIVHDAAEAQEVTQIGRASCRERV